MAWAPSYATEDELGSYLRIDDTADDPELGLALDGASRQIDQATNRQFGKVDSAEARTYPVRYDYDRSVWVVDVDDFQTAVGLAVDLDGTTVTVLNREPRNAAQKGRPWVRLAFTSDSEVTPSCSSDEVAVTALWGWTSVPVAIKQATLQQASRLFASRNAPFGIAGSPDSGSEMRLLSKLDPGVELTLKSYRRPRAVG